MSENKAFFITGTDTGIGKTWITLTLMRMFKNHGYRVAGMKPVACGADRDEGCFVNEDALAIQEQCSMAYDYNDINPYVFPEPISPNLAASRADIEIDLGSIVKRYETLRAEADVVLLEGIGGWRTPWGNGVEALDLVKLLEIPVLLVAGLRLGCINHTILTAESICSDEISLLGWIANRQDPNYLEVSETLLTLEKSLSVPLLASIPYQEGEESEPSVKNLMPATFLCAGGHGQSAT